MVLQKSASVEKQVAGATTSFFELIFLNKDMTILVPTNNLTAVGVRSLVLEKKLMIFLNC